MKNSVKTQTKTATKKVAAKWMKVEKNIYQYSSTGKYRVKGSFGGNYMTSIAMVSLYKARQIRVQYRKMRG